jgi:uncharacterized coiled-coil protein SlyX
METKAKLDKIQEIKKLNVQIMSVRSEMVKNEDQLRDLQRYKEFLDKLTPPENSAVHHKNSEGGDEENSTPIYFKTPQQLLDIFAELEENNLALIQNCQETEETLEELRSKIVETTIKM